jgi:hypothetical protein
MTRKIWQPWTLGLQHRKSMCAQKHTSDNLTKKSDFLLSEAQPKNALVNPPIPPQKSGNDL